MAGVGGLAGASLFAGKSLAVLGAGLLAGAVGGSALVATGAVDFGGGRQAASSNQQSAAGLPIVACPGQGPVIGTIPRGQQVLVTGRSEDGSMAELYWPVPGGSGRAWTAAGPLQLQGSLDSLPVARCDPPVAPTARPTPEPTPTPEATPAPTPEVTPAPTATPTPAPTPAANVAPKVSGLTISTRTVSFDQGRYCPNDPKTVTFSVSVSDADGISSVNLWYRPPGTSKYVAHPMTLSGGKYVATLDTTADNLRAAGELRYYVLAKDGNPSPLTTKLPKAGYQSMTVKVCKNTGPMFTSLSANPTAIGTGPDICKLPMNSSITVRASDVDGIKSMTLYFKGPGLADWTPQVLSLEKTSNSATGFGDIDPNRDGITRSGTISWYVVATDTKGLSTTSPTKSIRVTRCDNEATFDFGGATSTVYVPKACPDPHVVTMPVFASDKDNGDADSHRLSVVVTWRFVDVKGIAHSGRATAVWQYRNYFRATFVPGSDWVSGTGTLYYYATSTDIYGGTTRSFTYQAPLSVWQFCVF